jgi:signal transduction histidine kinase
MTAQATPFKTASNPQPQRRTRPAVAFHLVAMLVIGSAAAVLASTVIESPIPPRWLDAVLAVSLLVVGGSMLRSSNQLVGDERSAWRPISYAVIAAAAGQIVWSTLGGLASFGPGAPAATDVFHIAFYVLMSLGLLRMPFVRSSRVGTFRMAMDVLVGMVSGATVLWEMQEGAFADGLIAPMLHIVMLGAMLISLLRRSPYVFDSRLTVLLAGLVPPILVPELGPAGSGSPSLALWAFTAMCLGVLSIQLRRPQVRQSMILARSGRKRLLLPYAPVVGVALLFAVRVVNGDDLATGVLPLGMLVVLLGIVARSWAAVRENRQLSGLERDQLLASISHDIRTPLTVVAGFSEVLASSWDALSEAERREMVQMVRTGSNSLVDIIGDMESLARSELDAVPLDLERLSGKTLIADAIKLVFSIDGPLPIRAEVEPYLEVIGDHRRLVQVLRALFENAVRFGNGRILVVAKRDKVGRVIEVHDNGSGVAARHEKIIWERFERGQHELNANVPGSGLGLAVVRSIARAHGGDAWYRPSERLGGACFVIELPYDSSLALPRAE